MHISDMAAASVFLLKLPYEVYTLATSPTLSHINVGTGEDVTIKDLAFKIANIVGYNAQITFNPTRPDGTSQKLLSTAKLNAMGWESKISLDDGLKDIYDTLQPNGMLAIWSAGPDYLFTVRLKKIGFRVDTRNVQARPRKGSQHTIFLAKKL